MFSIIDGLKNHKVILLVLSLVILLVGFFYQQLHERHSELSIRPPVQYSDITLQPLESTLGLHAKIPFSTLIKAAEQATQQPQTGVGERQTCKRILGAKACATLQWQYQIERNGAVQLAQNGEAVRLSLPLSLLGSAGIDGSGGKLFGLQNKKFGAVIQLNADLKITIGEDWCPIIQSKLSHQWLTDPKIQLIGKIEVNLRKAADKAINSKLQKLQQKLSNLIDCSQFRTQVAEKWRVHHLPLTIPGQQQAYLELIPRTIAVSDTQPHENHVSITFEMTATTEVVNNKNNQTQLVVPKVRPEITQPGAVEFSLLINLPYSQIKELVSEKLLGEIDTADGKSFIITSFNMYPSGDKLIFDIGINASVLGKFFTSTGHIYISGRPIADPELNELRFENLQFTRMIDSQFWSALSTVLHQKILDTLSDAAVINLAPQVQKLESSIAATLSDRDKTANIAVVATAPEVRLVTVNPQENSLAAIIHISTRINATIPPEALLGK